jgi:hypothetical protein
MMPATFAAVAEAVAFGASWCVTVVVAPVVDVVAVVAVVTGATVNGAVVAAIAALAGIEMSGASASTSVARFTFFFTFRLRIAPAGPPRPFLPYVTRSNGSQTPRYLIIAYILYEFAAGVSRSLGRTA